MTGVSEIAESGNRLATLRALRDRLAREIDRDPEPRDLAALSSRLEKVLAEIDGLSGPEEHDAVDELRRKRAERLAGAEASGS